MIDLHFNGTQEEVVREVLALANMIAGGLRMQQAAAAAQVEQARGVQEASPPAEPVAATARRCGGLP